MIYCTNSCTVKSLCLYQKLKKPQILEPNLFETLKDVSNGEKHLVTHNSGDPVVLISQKEYNSLLDKLELLKEISLGAHKLDTEKWVSHEDALDKLENMKTKWK